MLCFVNSKSVPHALGPVWMKREGEKVELAGSRICPHVQLGWSKSTLVKWFFGLQLLELFDTVQCQLNETKMGLFCSIASMIWTTKIQCCLDGVWHDHPFIYQQDVHHYDELVYRAYVLKVTTIPQSHFCFNLASSPHGFLQGNFVCL